MTKQIRYASYTRVSTRDQNPDLQFRAIKDWFRIKKIKPVYQFDEKVSGISKKRPARDELLGLCRKRKVDCVVIWKLDRWGRSMLDLVSTFNELAEFDVDFISITDGVDSTTSTGRLLRNILSAFAEFERELIKERAKAGMDAYRERGGTWGRPPAAREKINNIEALKRDGWSNYRIAKEVGIHRTTVTRILKSQTNEENS